MPEAALLARYLRSRLWSQERAVSGQSCYDISATALEQNDGSPGSDPAFCFAAFSACARL